MKRRNKRLGGFSVIVFSVIVSCSDVKDESTPMSSEPSVKLALGQFAHGGIIIQLDADNKHGLVCSTKDLMNPLPWKPEKTSDEMIQVTDDFIGAGKVNTQQVIKHYSNFNHYAFSNCRDFDHNGYNDWFIPSKKTMELIFQSKESINDTAVFYGGNPFDDRLLESNYYWTSTEFDDKWAWVIHLSDGYAYYEYKDFNFWVRPVRAF